MPTKSPTPRLPSAALTLITVAVGVLIALWELNRLSGQIPSDQGYVWSFQDLMGPGVLASTQRSCIPEGEVGTSSGWCVAPVPDQQETWTSLLEIYTRLDIVLIACLAITAGLLLRRGARLLGVVLMLAALVDLLEDLVALQVGRPARDSALVLVLHGTSIAKWVAYLVVAIIAVKAGVEKARLRGPGGAGRIRRAVYLQRFSLVPLVPVAALSVLPGSGVLDQVPDVQRAWLDDLAASWSTIVMTVLCVWVIAALLFVFGRLRADHFAGLARPAGSDDTRELAHLWVWLLFPVPFILAGLALVDAGWGMVDWGRLLIFCTVPVGIAGVSWILRRLIRARRPACLRPGAPTHLSPDQLRTTVLAGDVIAVSALPIGALGWVRSFTAPVALGAGDAGRLGAAGWLLTIAALSLVLTWPLAGWLVGRLDTGQLAAWLTASRAREVSVLGGVATLAFVSMLVLASGAALRFGVVALVMLCMLTLTVGLSAMALLTQGTKPPELFWTPLTRTRGTPLVTLLTLAVIAATLTGTGSDLHRPRHREAWPRQDDRVAWANAWANWTPDTACGPETGRFRVRPMLLIAAEGGGIRAAYWTTAVLDRLAAELPATPGCASTLFSAGASGGAVGLTVRQGWTGTASADAVGAMSDSAALSEGALGLLLTDVLAAATGLMPGSPVAWHDRAAKIEQAWEPAGGLDRTFFTDGRHAITGKLILNTTSVATGCRMLLSQIQLPRHAAAGQGYGRCDQATHAGRTPVPNSVDMVRCLPGVPSASTAALLASRFPYVTPSAVLDACSIDRHPVWPADQLVDGGYVENSGLGTIIDLAPEWLDRVRTHNAATAQRGSGTLIAPLVVYLDNGLGADILAQPYPETLELVVPPLTALRAGGAQASVPTMLQRLSRLVSPESLVVTESAEATSDAREAIARSRAYGVAVIIQSTTPSIEAPLGWSLSQWSRQAMDAAVSRQASTPCREPGPNEGADVLCRRGFGTLKTVIDAFGANG